MYKNKNENTHANMRCKSKYTGYQVYIFDHVCDHEVGGDNDQDCDENLFNGDGDVFCKRTNKCNIEC